METQHSKQPIKTSKITKTHRLSDKKTKTAVHSPFKVNPNGPVNHLDRKRPLRKLCVLQFRKQLRTCLNIQVGTTVSSHCRLSLLRVPTTQDLELSDSQNVSAIFPPNTVTSD